MKPIEFPEQNCMYAKDQPGYRPLPVHKTPDGMAISCWALTWRERLRVLLTGKMWWCVLTFNRPLQPHFASVDRPFTDTAELAKPDSAAVHGKPWEQWKKKNVTVLIHKNKEQIVNTKHEENGWRKYFEKLEALRMAKEQLEKKEITQEEYERQYDEVEILMTELGEPKWQP